MSQKPLRRLALVGGTHGNELTGIQIVRDFMQSQELDGSYNFKVDLLLANQDAIAACRRYIHKDLNRCFETELLSAATPANPEIARAQEINQILGPKGSQDACDLILDIHNSTANMGLSLIISQLDDPLIQCICSHLSQCEPRVKIYYQPEADRSSNPYLPSVAKRDLCIEVGPQAHGTLRPELYLSTKALVLEVLEIVDAWNEGRGPEVKPFKYYRHLDNVDFPRSSTGEIHGVIHPDLEFRDYAPMEPGDPMFLGFDGVIQVWNGDKPVWPVFINEAAYYEKRLAFSLTQEEYFKP